MSISRRSFLKAATAIGASFAWAGTACSSRIRWQERRDLYPQGVASGDPDPHSVILWTRRPYAQGTRELLTVEVAEDDALAVRVSLPKFELKGQSVSLRESLLALGMTRAFDERTADFSGMLSPDVDKLWISDVLHKAFVRVDEKGTEAAAATAVVLAGTTSVPADVKTFRADRPFLFFVRDIPTNTAIFAGRMVAP